MHKKDGMCTPRFNCVREGKKWEETLSTSHALLNIKGLLGVCKPRA
jgi:hypothetical protein